MALSGTSLRGEEGAEFSGAADFRDLKKRLELY